jgi:hypothetical protein
MFLPKRIQLLYLEPIIIKKEKNAFEKNSIFAETEKTIILYIG